MYARAVEEAAVQLRGLRHEQWGSLALGGSAVAGALAATQAWPALAVPLFVGGLVVGAGGVRAALRRSALLDHLAGDRDAYVISDVLAHASLEGTMDRRRTYAALIRRRLTEPALEPPIQDAAEELEALASDLVDEGLALDPACAVLCVRMLTDLVESPFLRAAAPRGELRSCVGRIRGGFSSRPAGSAAAATRRFGRGPHSNATA